MRRDPVVFAWVAGLALAVAIYVFGPDRLVFRLLDSVHLFGWWLNEVVAQLGGVMAEAVRALAIGLYVTFFGLGLSVRARGGQAGAALFWVSAGFWLLVGGVIGLDDEGQGRWVLALALVALAAIAMTARLRAVRATASRTVQPQS